MKPKAYSYIRFSSPEQAKGDSLRRQMDLSAQYAKENGLEIDTSLTMHDKGLSAFTGKHREIGALGVFIKAVEDGRVPPGSFLLIESLDRLSRETARKAFNQFSDLLEKGITIVTLSDRKVYAGDSLHDMDLMMSLMIMMRAHEESAIKSKRGKASWENKFRNAKFKPVTKWVPSWLKLDNGQIVPIPDRVKVVQDIYRWTVDGLGTSLIIKRLEAEKISPWGVPDNINVGGGGRRNRIPKKWYPSYVQRLLHNRAVLGEYAPKGGAAILDYFPAIIDEKLFYKVQKIRKSRDVSQNGKGGGRKGSEVTNLFSGLLKCGYSLDDNRSGYRCGGNNQSIVCVSKGGRSATKYLQCSRQRDGNTGCDECKKYWRYNDFELSMLTHITELDVSVLTGQMDDLDKEIKSISDEIAVIDGKLGHNQIEIKKLNTAISEYAEIPKFIVDRGLELETQSVSLKGDKGRLELHLHDKIYQRQNSNRKASNFLELIALMETMSGMDLFDLRLKLAEMFKDVIDTVEIYFKGSFITPEFLKRFDKYSDAKKHLMNLAKEYPNGGNPFFLVRYKSGEERMVRPYDEAPMLYRVKKTRNGEKAVLTPDSPPTRGYSVKTGRKPLKRKKSHLA